ncbi:hypothetical protein H3143_00130 [Mycoplasma tullyi]|uniref:DUF3137 domain-containing protein n=1 Tax=Mycoplasma tullyi TaxID=1612150 RepID=A0A7D7XWP1_9MOLU|nr:hypothetical protein [Mycoplasma tullyi]QMT98553.1 hypothetical protein H3143_00130 [Mycoplasma tullyi]
MISKILNPKVRRVIIITAWILAIIPLIATYFFINKPIVLYSLFLGIYPIVLTIYLVHYYWHLKARNKLNEQYQSKAIFEGLEKTKNIKVERIKEQFLYKETIKQIIKSSDNEIQNLDKRFDQPNFYQEYLINDQNKELRISCLEFCKSKYLLNYPYKYDCYYWVELKNVSDAPFVLLNKKEAQNPGFTKYLINKLKPNLQDKYVLYTNQENFDLSKVIDNEILNDLLFKKSDLNINLINKNNKTFLLLGMSFNIFNLYYGSDYFDETTYNQLVIQRVENIKILTDLFYSLRECIND